MIPLNLALHNRPGQSLPPGPHGNVPVPRSTVNESRSPLPSHTHSTSRATVSFVSHDPETSPFSAVVTSTGPMAKINPFRFSTKWWDEETGLGWWGMRWYSPEIAKWLSRDPIGEDGGEGLYAFVINSPILRVDSLGLQTEPDCCKQADIDQAMAGISPGQLDEIKALKDKGRPCFTKAVCGKCSISGIGGEYTPPSGDSGGYIVICSSQKASIETIIHELQHAAKCGSHKCGSSNPTDQECGDALCSEIEAYTCAARGRGGPCDDTRTTYDKVACVKKAWNGSVLKACPNCIKRSVDDGGIFPNWRPKFEHSCPPPKCAITSVNTPY